ncbi:MAG: ATP-binding protein [Anaerolineae bacterium]
MTEKQVEISINIRDDMRDERASYLGSIYFITILVGVVIFAILAQMNSNPGRQDGSNASIIWGYAVFGITVVLSFILKKLERTDAASQAYMTGFSVAIGLQLWYIGPNPLFYFLLVIPVGLSALLLEPEDIPWQTGIIITSAVIPAVLRISKGDPLTAVIPPAGLYGVLGFISYFKMLDLRDRILFTIESQSKDSLRAEHFYDQSEELQKALLQVQHYSSRLEILNKQLAEAQQKAESASKAKSTFLSNMSHELRTPLNVIIGYSSSMLNMPQMFENKRINPAHRPYLELIEENGHYLLGLINDTLDLSKIEAGKLDLHREIVSLSDIFRGVMATATGLLKGKPIQLRSNYPDDLPEVWADPMRVRQIILNLMSNAVKFTESGNVTLSAQLAGEFIEISVTDTGIGIPEKALAAIFDRFEQAEKDTDRKFGGTGLGLDISKQLSLMHGGDLTVSSEVGRGSTFTFTLPLAGINAQADDAQFPTSKLVDESSLMLDDGEPQIVLLAEDDIHARRLLRQVLEDAGHVVVDTATGSEALELAEGLLPAVIILDVHLPDANGWQLLKQLRSSGDTQNIPVIMCTADNDVPIDVQNMTSVYYLPKPIIPEAVTGLVMETLSPKAVIPNIESSPEMEKLL